MSKRIFTEADVGVLQDGEDFRQCQFDGLVLRHKNLSSATFAQCTLRHADLTDARLNGTVFKECDLSGAKLAGANLFSARFENCKLLGLNLTEGTTLTATKFVKCNLDYVNLRGLNLENMRFEDCSMVEADLSLTQLKKAVFAKCNLERVDWSEATFFQTDLRGSQLAGMNLRVHKLAGAIISAAQLQELATELGIKIVG